MNKPELLATAGTMEELARVIDAGANAVQIGEAKFGMRLPGEFSPDMVGEAVRIAHAKGANIFVVVNNIMHNDVLPELPGYLAALERLGADAIVFGDPAVLIAMREAGVTLPLHWNTEMTVTNFATAGYWARKGATRAVLARELNMDQVLEIKRNVSVEVQVQVHGTTNIFHSKRKMVENYMAHQGDANRLDDAGPGKGLYLIEAERRDERHPIYEDRNGTHIMSADDICMIENVHELIEGGIDSLKIEGLLKTATYNETVVHAYRQAIDAYAADPANYVFNEEWLAAIERVQPSARPLSFGFFYKEQVY